MINKYLFVLLFAILISCDTAKKEEDKTEDKSEIVKEEAIKKVPKNQRLSSEEQISSAIIAVPMEGREGATVYGYDENGDLIVIREGDNNFVCIADNPDKDGFQVVAYHKSLEPMMSRGRELNKAGKSRQEKEETRSSEAKSGKLKMPKNPATLHIYYGEDGFFNTESGEIENAKYRYVVYIPYATQESTGLSLKPNESNHPWLMFPGKYNAHIMISPKE